MGEDWSKFDHYGQIRVTMEHKYIRNVTTLLEHEGYYHWIVYPHTTKSEHFHVCIPGVSTDSHVNGLRRAFTNAFGSGGNGLYGFKRYHNGLRSFVFYGGHEGTKPLYQSPEWAYIIHEVESTTGYYSKVTGIYKYTSDNITNEKDWTKDRAWVLTYSNVVNVALRYHRKYKTEPTLEATLRHMVKNGKWRPNRELRKNTLDEQLCDDFQFMLGRRSDPNYGWIS